MGTPALTRKSLGAGELSVLAVFVVSRLAYFAAGLRYNARPVAGFWQMIDPALMRTDLFRSVWYLHMQPPGYNLAVGLAVKIFPDHYAGVLWAAQIAMGAAIAVSLYPLLVWLGVPAVWSVVLTSVFMISPGCVLFENKATYEYPVLLFLLLSALALARFCERLTTRRALAFFGCLLVVMLIRNTFHIVQLLAIAVGLFWFLPAGRRAILIGVLPALLIAGGMYVKNGLLFGRFTASTWAGMTLGVTTTAQLTDEEADDLVKRGVISPLAEVDPFSELSEYDPFIHRPAKTGIPVLDQEVTSTGHPNFNNLAYLQVHDQYLADALAILRHYPIAYARSIQISCFSYFLPASDMVYFNDVPAPIQAWERAFNTVVFGQLRQRKDRMDFLELGAAGYGASRVLFTGMFLLAIIPASVAWGAAQLLVPRQRREWTQAQLTVLGFMLFTTVSLSLVSTLFSTYDGNRYRFPLDGFFIALFGGMLAHAFRWLRARRSYDGHRS